MWSYPLSSSSLLLLRGARRGGVVNVWRRTFFAAGPYHVGVLFVPQREAWIVERFGKFHRRLDSGLNFALPAIESIAYKHSLKEIIYEIHPQGAITKDNVHLEIDGVLFARVIDPINASYNVQDSENGIIQLSQTNLRSQIGKITLDRLFQERESVSLEIVNAINVASKVWGVECLRYEIRNVKLPEKVKIAMQQQVEAERQKRAKILLSEAEQQSTINIASGKREAVILESEAFKIQKINEAEGNAKSIILNAEAQAESLQRVGEKLCNNSANQDAARLVLGSKYVESFSNIAQKSNTIVLSGDISNGEKMITQGLSIYKNLLGNHKNVDNDDQSANVRRSEKIAVDKTPLLMPQKTTQSKKSSS